MVAKDAIAFDYLIRPQLFLNIRQIRHIQIRVTAARIVSALRCTLSHVDKLRVLQRWISIELPLHAILLLLLMLLLFPIIETLYHLALLIIYKLIIGIVRTGPPTVIPCSVTFLVVIAIIPSSQPLYSRIARCTVFGARWVGEVGGARILHPLPMLLRPERLLLLLQPILVIQAVIGMKGSLLLRVHLIFRITTIYLPRTVHGVDFLMRAPHLPMSLSGCLLLRWIILLWRYLIVKSCVSRGWWRRLLLRCRLRLQLLEGTAAGLGKICLLLDAHLIGLSAEAWHGCASCVESGTHENGLEILLRGVFVEDVGVDCVVDVCDVLWLRIIRHLLMLLPWRLLLLRVVPYPFIVLALISGLTSKGHAFPPKFIPSSLFTSIFSNISLLLVGVGATWTLSLMII